MRASWLTLARVAALSACVLGCLACRDDAAEKREAEALLQGFDSLQELPTLAERERGLETLGKLPLTAAENARVRDLCVSAHRALLQAEVESTTARKSMQDATAAGKPLDPEAGKVIMAAIERSNTSLGAAQKRFPECQSALQGLLVKQR